MKEIYENVCRFGNREGELHFNPELAAYMLEGNPFELDLLELLPLDNMDFIEALYLTLFNRTLDENARYSWEQRADWPKEQFQATALQALLSSDEYRHSGVTVRNNIYAGIIRQAEPVIESSEERSWLSMLAQPVWQKTKPVVKIILRSCGLLEPAKRLRKAFSTAES